jgi:hypothetical protein
MYTNTSMVAACPEPFEGESKPKARQLFLRKSLIHGNLQTTKRHVYIFVNDIFSFKTFCMILGAYFDHPSASKLIHLIHELQQLYA